MMGSILWNKKVSHYLKKISKINYQVNWSVVLGETTFILKNRVESVCSLFSFKMWIENDKNNLAQCQSFIGLRRVN